MKGSLAKLVFKILIFFSLIFLWLNGEKTFLMSFPDIRRRDKIQVLTICEATSVRLTKAQPDLHAALVKVENVKCTSMAKAM